MYLRHPERAEGVHQDLLDWAETFAESLVNSADVYVGDKGGVRDAATQAELLDAGKSEVRHSAHEKGLALDLVLYEHGNTRAPLPDTDPRWQQLGESAEAAGFGWGGEWSSLRDYGHVEFSDWRTRAVAWASDAVDAVVEGAQDAAGEAVSTGLMPLVTLFVAAFIVELFLSTGR